MCSAARRKPAPSICFTRSSRAIFMPTRRADRQVALLEVDVDDLAAGLEHPLQEAEVLRLVLDVVPGVDDHEAVDRGVRQQRVVGVREDGDDVANAGVAQPAVEVADHVRADVHGVDAARVAHGAGEAER